LIYNESMAMDKIDNMNKKIEQAALAFRKNPVLNKSMLSEIESIGKPFVEVSIQKNRATFKIDETLVEYEKKKAGKSVLITKLNDPSDKIVKEYFAKDIIEKIFKFAKQYGNLCLASKKYIVWPLKVQAFASVSKSYISLRWFCPSRHLARNCNGYMLAPFHSLTKPHALASESKNLGMMYQPINERGS